MFAASSLAPSAGRHAVGSSAATGSSAMSAEMAATRRGKAAVAPKMVRGDTVSRSEPEKYADSSPPTAAADQQMLCSPAAAAASGASRARSTTSESATTSDTATASDPRVKATTAAVDESTKLASASQLAAPRRPARTRYDRRLYPNSGTRSLTSPYLRGERGR